MAFRSAPAAITYSINFLFFMVLSFTVRLLNELIIIIVIIIIIIIIKFISIASITLNVLGASQNELQI